MYIYFVALQARPGLGTEVAPIVAEARDVAIAEGADATAWIASTGAPIGAFGISARVESMAELTEVQQKFAKSAAYAKVTTKLSGLLAGPSETYLNQVVAAVGDAGKPNPFVTVTRTTIMNGHLGDALGWSSEILEYVNKVTGLSGMLTTAAAGNFFEVSWIFSAASAADGDTANDKLMADPGYIPMIDKGGSFFVPGSAQRSSMMQLP